MIRSKRAFEGEFEIDHRDSPGVTLTDVAPGGAEFRAVPIVGKGQRYESAVVCCPHCQAVVILNPLRNLANHPRHSCPKCSYRYVCDRPSCVMMADGRLPHVSMQQVFDQLQEAAARATALAEI